MRSAAKSIARRAAIVARRRQFAHDEPRVPLPITRPATWRDIKREWINRSKYMPHIEDAKHREQANV